MRKGFIELTGLLLFGLVMLAGGAGALVAQCSGVERVGITVQDINCFQKLRNLLGFGFPGGAAAGSGSFPTSSVNNFQDDAVINAGDWNALERKIGIDGSLDTSSLDYGLAHPSSTNPGHTHESSSVSGTIGIVGGGTATNTVPADDRILVGDNSVYDLVEIPDCNGTLDKLLYSTSTNTFSCGADLDTLASSSQSIAASSTFINGFSSDATTTIFSVTIASNTLSSSNVVRAKTIISRFRWATAGDTVRFTVEYGGETLLFFDVAGDSPELTGTLVVDIIASSTNFQFGVATLMLSRATTSTIPIGDPTTAFAFGIATGTLAVSATSTQSFTLTTKNNRSDSNLGVSIETWYVEKISK
ncbi:MAG TPA: hypothetical protein ENH82_05375 [bacterium]|nr:hypothetical protein [bacterium]